MISLLNPQPNERIDLADFTYLSQDSLLGALRAMPSALLIDAKKQPLWVIRGFTLSNPSGQVLSVARGSALLSLRKGAQILTGVVTDDGQVAQSVDLSSYAAGTYGVFIRFVLAPDGYDTRAFFRASGGGEEYGQSVPTRLNGNWEISVSRKTPGEEWLQIGSVTTPSMTLLDQRPLYFEGRVDQATDSGWGTADDRSADRSAHSLGDLQTALAALRQSIEDVKGPGLARWYSSFIAGQSIGFAGTQVAGRTQWFDSSFYAQGDAARPRLNFAADGAHLAYTRASALLAATGAELPTAQGSATTALALRSGTGDEALLRGGFYRSGTATGFAAADASWSRGVPGAATGGVGFYGAQGLMGGAGVGLGYVLGNAAPSLFVGASGNVGVQVASAAQLLTESRAALQVAAPAGTARGLAITNGAATQVALAYHNNTPSALTPASNLTAAVLDLPSSAPLLIAQGRSAAYLKAGRWTLGAGPEAVPADNATVSIATGPSVIASQVTNQQLGITTTFFAQTSSLVVDNLVPVSDAAGSNVLPSRLSFASNGQRLYDMEGGTVAWALNDVTNGQGVLSYGRTTKVMTMGVPLAASTFRGTQQTAYTFSPAITHKDTYAGNTAQVMVGTSSPTTAAYNFITIASTGNAVRLQFPLRLMTGQSLSAFMMALAVTNTQSIDVDAFVMAYSTDSDSETRVPGVLPQSTIVAGTNVGVVLNRSFGPVACAPNQCLSAVVNLTSTASFRVDSKYLAISLSTSSLNPQRQ